jgi:DNA-binding LytR/AlgR family response regulator
MIRVLIVDDEAPAHKVIETYCSKVPDLKIVGNCYDATSALCVLREQKVDLIFLDIQMGDLTGFELLQTLEKIPQIVIVTAYAEFALKSYDFGITDYLLKPVRYARFLQAAEKVRKHQQHGHKTSQTEVTEMLTEKPAKVASFMTADQEGVELKIKLNEILWAESTGNYVKLHSTSAVFVKRITLSELEARLKPLGFLRVHKSFLIREDAIEAIDGNRIRIGGTFIPIGATYKQAVRDALKGMG